MKDDSAMADEEVPLETPLLVAQERAKTGRPPAPIRVHFEPTGRQKNASTALLRCKFCQMEVAGRAISLEGHLKRCEEAPPEVRPTGVKRAKSSILKNDPSKKPCTATANMVAKFTRLILLQSNAINSLHVMLRDKRSTHVQFKKYADRLMRILAEEALAACTVEFSIVWTPTGAEFSGLRPNSNICAVSIVRAGDALLEQVLMCEPAVSVGKILIQRDESTAEKLPIVYYAKLPPRMSAFERVLLLDPMLATGGSVMKAIQLLLDAGVAERDIIFANVLSCPQGLESVFQAYSQIRVVTTAIDPELNENKYIVPGLGDYGDRYYNTTD
ncbi:uracil phosphoribosyltransferase [Thraustotheca clavata]|uniref:uracil phosphoribosyltransferase n=1 Tax=Thraustotheca clavata TaxID=74557 RepID=A0A1V9ZXP1_9STRA|nr:uracil phosphoribosyltransferase [Thraustotheca clavata]